MEVTVEMCPGDDSYYSYEAYDVHIDDHRILTISTNSKLTASKWLADLQKTLRKKTDQVLVVGLCACRDPDRYPYSTKAHEEPPYQMLQFCVATHCLLYELPECDRKAYDPPKFLADFLANPRMLFVGLEIEPVAKKLEKDHGLKVGNYRDLRSMALRGLKRDDLDIGRYNLNQLSKVVLGKRKYLERSNKRMKWYLRRFGQYGEIEVNEEAIKFMVAEPYLNYQIGVEVLRMINTPAASSSSTSLKKKEKKKK